MAPQSGTLSNLSLFLLKSWGLLGLCLGAFLWGRSTDKAHWELIGLSGALFGQVMTASTICSSGGPLACRLRRLYPFDERLLREAGLFRGLGWFAAFQSPIGTLLFLAPAFFQREPQTPEDRKRSAPFFYSSPWLLSIALFLLTVLLSFQALVNPASGPKLSNSPSELTQKLVPPRWTLALDPLSLNLTQLLSETSESLQLAAKMVLPSDAPSDTDSEKTWSDLVLYHQRLHEEARRTQTHPPRGGLILLKVHSELLKQVIEVSQKKPTLRSSIGENSSEKAFFLRRLFSALDSSLQIHETQSQNPSSLRRSNPAFFLAPPASSSTLIFVIFERVIELRVLTQNSRLIQALLTQAQDLIPHLPLDEQAVIDFQFNQLQQRFEKTSAGKLLRSIETSREGHALKEILEL